MESPSNTHLLSAGAKCAHPHCGLHDYLPFKCQYCKESFCSDHFRPSAHQCQKEVSNDRIAPPCPLCQTPVSIPIGQDPDSAMERHFNTACEVLGNKKSSTPRCAKLHCEKVLFAPIVCESCKRQFCAAHRHPGSHKCVVTSASSPPQASARTPSKPLAAIGSRFESSKKPGSSSSSSTRVSPTKAPAPAMAPKSLKSKAPSNPAPMRAAPTAESSSASHVHNPFSKTDRLVPMKASKPSITIPVKSTSSPSVSPPSSPRIPSIPSQERTSRTSMRAVQEDIASKPKLNIEITSFVPHPIFGTA